MHVCVLEGDKGKLGMRGPSWAGPHGSVLDAWQFYHFLYPGHGWQDVKVSVGIQFLYVLVNPEPQGVILSPLQAGGLCRCPSGSDLRS